MGIGPTLLRAEISAIDRRVVALGRGLGGMRLAIGEGLVRLERAGGVRALGFPNLASYARQTLGRSGRWAADVRALARRLEGLPRLRSALMSGTLSSSMVELLARVATPEDEAGWIERARGLTVRDLRAELMRRRLETIDDDESGRVTVTARVGRLDAWAFEHAKLMLETVGARRGDGVIEAMLAEGLSEIIARYPDVDLPRTLLEDFELGSRALDAELAATREDVEAAGDAAIPKDPIEPISALSEVDWPDGLQAIDLSLREVAGELARRDLELAQWGERAERGLVWQRTGYRSFDHYCRDRVGVSPSSMAARLALGRRLAELPELAVALAEGRVGFEAARAIARVAGAATLDAWVARAQARTVKHLREEIDAVAMMARAEGRDVRRMDPPDGETLEGVRDIERSVIATVSGLPRDVEEVEVGEVAAGQMSGGVALRVSMGEDLGRFWRTLERVHASLAVDESFVELLVRAVMRSWSGAVPGLVAYWDVYLRDRWRCASPVCTSRTTTPHHVRFRSHGGGEERSNLISLCEICHLELVHEGRLEVVGTAPDGLRWSALGWNG